MDFSAANMIAMRRFFVEKSAIHDGMAYIQGSEARHIRNVLRLRPGDRIGLFDDSGLAYDARIEAVSAGRISVSVTRSFSPPRTSSFQITVAQGYLKDRKMDGLVRQVTELGIVRWAPFMARRSVPRPEADRLEKRIQRWEKIAKEAVKQCRRGHIPHIGPVLSFEKMLALGTSRDLKIVFWEGATEPLHAGRFSDAAQEVQGAVVVLGPEGGLTPREVDQAAAAGFVSAALGPRILRADTATVAACTLVQYLFGDMT